MSNFFPSIRQLTQRSNALALLLCILLACAGELSSFQFLYGITFCFTGVASLVALRLLGYWQALLLTAVIITAGTWLNHPAFHYIILLETAVVGLLIKRRKSGLLSSDALFWLIGGIPLLFMLAHSNIHLSASDKLLMAGIVALNGFFNAFAAQMVYQYLPLRRLRNHQSERARHSFNTVLLHLSIGIVLCSFLLNIFLNSISSFKEAAMYAAGASAREIHRITAQWNNSPLKPEERSPLEQLAFLQKELAQQREPLNGLVLHVVDPSGFVVATTGQREALGKPLQHMEGNQWRPVSNSLFLATPRTSWQTLTIETWHEGFFIYKEQVPGSSYQLYADLPIAGYTNYLFSKYSVHLLSLAGFASLAALLTWLINRWMASSMTRLARATTNLPHKLAQRVAIDWPTSNIQEIELLIANFKHMSTGLVQMFAAEQKNNERLMEQARLLGESEERLNLLAYYDVLTGLPNRLQFNHFALELLSRFSPEDKPIAIMFADINRFKQINDTLGHDIGDVLLQQAATRFASVMERRGRVFRLGGDEFVFVVQGMNTELEEAAQAIIDSFHEPFHLDSHKLFMTVSLGISVCPSDGDELDALVRHADIAMYNAKEQGDGCYRFFNRQLVSAMTERMQLENELYSALKHRQFSLFYQPKIRTATGELSGLEALIRWRHPELGMIPPDKFIPLAEQSGFILEIDKWVFYEACRQNKEWQDAGLKAVCVSVNVSARHFYQGNLVDMVEDALQETGLDPQYVSLEITEGVFMQNMEQVIANIEHLRSRGIQISVDDFGTGYSSLNQLQRLPISDVKLDRSFIQGITTDPKKSSIVKAIIELVHSMNMKVVAEGVETEEELKFCEELHCDELQGYLFSKPLPAGELALKLCQAAAPSA